MHYAYILSARYVLQLYHNCVIIVVIRTVEYKRSFAVIKTNQQ